MNKKEQFLIRNRKGTIFPEKNRKGWIRIVEAFVAILLIAGIVLIVVEQDQNKREDVSSRIYIPIISVIREVQLDDSLRNEIINIQESSLPVEWEEFPTQAPLTGARIIEKTPGYLECVGKICATNDVCLLVQNPEKTIYAESVVISSNLQTYNPRILKLFCWER